jgi:hypothetical protein
LNFGDFELHRNLNYVERMVLLGPLTGAYAQGQRAQWHVSSVSMPWAGTLTAVLNHNGWYDAGVCTVTVWPWGTAPSSFYAGTFAEGCPGASWAVLPLIAQWTGLTSGQVVNVGLDASVDASNVSWHPQWISGSVRMFRP